MAYDEDLLRRRLLDANNNGGNADLRSFDLPLITDLLPRRARGSPTPAFTRATTKYIQDHGGVSHLLVSGEKGFIGGRRVRNVVSSSESTTGWTCEGTTAPSQTSTTFSGTTYAGVTFPAGVATYTESRARISGSNFTGVYRGTGYADYTWGSTFALSRALTGSESITVYCTGTGGSNLSIFFNSTFCPTTPTRLAVKDDGFIGGGFTGTQQLYAHASGTLTAPVSVYARYHQVEPIAGKSNTNPSEYVSVGVLSSPYHGTGADGTKVFAYENGNTVSNNVVTETTGAAISASTLKGGNIEAVRINNALYSRTWTNAAWVTGGGGVTKAQNAVGTGGVTNSAGTLTATGANGTVLQSVTLASQANVFQPFVKRGVGTGAIEVTVDGGTTWKDITSEINSSTFTQVQATKTAANPQFGFRIVTSGDAIIVDHGDCQGGSFASSPIPTTTVAVQRNADVLQYASSGNLKTNDMTLVMDWTPSQASMGTVFLFGTYVDADNYTGWLHDGTNIIGRRRIGGVNADATKALAYAAGTTYRLALRLSSTTGADVFVAGVKGTNDPTTTACQIGTNFQIGGDGNSLQQDYSSHKNFKVIGISVSDAQVAAL